MTIHFPRAAKRFVKVFSEHGIHRYTVIGVKGDHLIGRRNGVTVELEVITPSICAICQ
jgi:hypothetical protein